MNWKSPALAINGGEPELPDGPPDWPLPDPEVLSALQAAFEDGSWGRYHGPHVHQLETDIAEFHGVPHAWTCCSGTVAVELALRACRVGAGDEVVLAGYDFPGNFRAIEAVGARPVLIDINPATWSLNPAQLPKANGDDVKAIVVSHLHGGLADMPTIRDYAQQNGLSVVEDACQAPGARIDGRAAGTWGDVGVLSFGGSKLLTAGRGGAVLCGQDDQLQRIKIYCERGNDATPLSELQAAVLRPQLARLDERNDRRAQRVQQLLEATGELDLLRPVAPARANRACYYKLAWMFDSQRVSCDRESFTAALRAEGVAMDGGFRGFTRRGSRRCRRVGTLEHSAQAAAATVLLHHPVLLESESTIDRVAIAIRKVLDSVERNADLH
jgi:dTDP-4-amino-4,6-dideoxygalactose transaminase